MAVAIEESAKTPKWKSFAKTTFALIAAWVVGIWLIEILDSTLLNDRLQGQGIQPRTIGGLDGILWAPFLHSDFSHVLSNTAPLAMLGSLVAIRGKSYWLAITAISIVGGGLLTWIVARGGNHIGASGAVFAYLGALLGSAVFERKLKYIAPAVLAMFFYGTILVGLVPRSGISWEGHLTGLIAGAVAAYVVAKFLPASEPTKVEDPDGIDGFNPDDFDPSDFNF